MRLIATGRSRSHEYGADGTDVLQILVFYRILTPGQVELVRRSSRLNSTSIEHAVVDLGNQEFLSAEAEELDPAAALGTPFETIRDRRLRRGRGVSTAVRPGTAAVTAFSRSCR